MAQRVTVALEADLEGGPAGETLRFAKNVTVFRTQLAVFVEHARRAEWGQSRRGTRSAASRQRSGEIRAWAKDQGITVSERGRIPRQCGRQIPSRQRRTLTTAAHWRAAPATGAGRGH